MLLSLSRVERIFHSRLKSALSSFFQLSLIQANNLFSSILSSWCSFPDYWGTFNLNKAPWNSFYNEVKSSAAHFERIFSSFITGDIGSTFNPSFWLENRYSSLSQKFLRSTPLSISQLRSSLLHLEPILKLSIRLDFCESKAAVLSPDHKPILESMPRFETQIFHYFLVTTRAGRFSRHYIGASTSPSHFFRRWSDFYPFTVAISSFL